LKWLIPDTDLIVC